MSGFPPTSEVTVPCLEPFGPPDIPQSSISTWAPSRSFVDIAYVIDGSPVVVSIQIWPEDRLFDASKPSETSRTTSEFGRQVMIMPALLTASFILSVVSSLSSC